MIQLANVFGIGVAAVARDDGGESAAIEGFQEFGEDA